MNGLRPIFLGVCAAFFFAFTFVLNRAMELSGGSWIWSASLRYFFMVPLLLLIVIGRKNLRPLLNVMKEQPIQSSLVAICSGVIATVLFFYATDMVRGNMQKLAAVEATQSMEILFTVAGELVLLTSPFPSALSWCSMFLIMLGMILHSYISQKRKVTHDQEISAQNLQSLCKKP